MEISNWHSKLLQSVYRNGRSVFVITCLVAVSGCAFQINSRAPANALPPAGFFGTPNAGESWESRGSLYQIEGQRKVFGYTVINAVVFDPQDANSIYVATDTGLYYTFNRGLGWFQTLSGEGVVNAVAVDPTDRCTVYAVVHNSVRKSVDCSRTWERIHFSSLQGEFFTSILVSRDNPEVVYVGTSKGTILESTNGGRTWQVKMFLSSSIDRLLSDPKQPLVWYVVTAKFGIQKTSDNGTTWESLNELPVRGADGEEMVNRRNEPLQFKELNGSQTFYDLVIDTSQTDGLLYASGYGIFRLIAGDYWQEIAILNKPREQKVLSITIDDQTGQTMYFATTGAFYRSFDGGQEWSVRTAPASGVPRFVRVFSDNPQEVVFAVNPPPQK